MVIGDIERFTSDIDNMCKYYGYSRAGLSNTLDFSSPAAIQKMIDNKVIGNIAYKKLKKAGLDPDDYREKLPVQYTSMTKRDLILEIMELKRQLENQEEGHE